RDARALGEGGEGQRLRTAFGQQGAGPVQHAGSLPRPVLGHGGRSNPWHAVICTDAPSRTGVVRPEPQLVRLAAGAGRQTAASASFAGSCGTDLVWIWLTLRSVTRRTLPISARVRPS